MSFKFGSEHYQTAKGDHFVVIQPHPYTAQSFFGVPAQFLPKGWFLNPAIHEILEGLCAHSFSP
jgi:hypothetical protein